MNSPFRADLFQDKLAFVAGGTSGINLGTAISLSKFGAKVIVAGRNLEKATQAAAAISDQTGNAAIGMSCDVREYAALEAIYKKIHAEHGPVDILISGAAGNFLTPIVGMSANAFKTVVDIDLIGTFNVFRASFDHLCKPGASLIAITAPQGTQEMPYQAHVCSAKAGVNMLVRCMALEWGAAGLRVNAISPGPIADTYGLEVWAGDRLDSLLHQVPLKRFGTKDDIGELAVFLCSEAARNITGCIYRCDGGLENGDASPDMLTPFARA